MAWITPKTDFTAADYYNAADLNRVENNIDVVNGLIYTLFSITLTLTSITNRTTSSIEFYDSLNRVENNTLLLKNYTYEPDGWITPKTTWASLDKFDYLDANRLDSNLLALYTMITGVISSALICGNANSVCGQDYTYL